MTNELIQQETRQAVLRLLSEREVTQVSDPLAARKLSVGEEYLDLEEPTAGVQRSRESGFPKGRVLPRRAVDAQTWQGILALLQGDRS